MIRKIAITGPESTGKTWLAENLAARYNTIWVPEFARRFLHGLGRPYNYEDILYIAKKQFIQNEEAFSKASHFLFCDTELIVTKIWCQVKYGLSHSWINEHIKKQNFDLYLIPDIDLPWEPDPQREHPKMREKLMKLYIDELVSHHFPYVVISGGKTERLNIAVEALEAMLNTQHTK